MIINFLNFLGYNIELVVRHEDVQRLMDFVRKQLPGRKVNPLTLKFHSSMIEGMLWQEMY